MEENFVPAKPEDESKESTDVKKQKLVSSHPDSAKDHPSKDQQADKNSKVDQETNEVRGPEPKSEEKHTTVPKLTEKEEPKQVSEPVIEHKNPESKAIQDTQVIKSDTEDSPPEVVKTEFPVKPDPEEALIPSPSHTSPEPHKAEVPNPSTSHPPHPAHTKDSNLPLYTFSIHYNTNYGEKIVVVGSAAELGNWDVSKGLNLEWSEGNLWKASIPLNCDSIEYKYVCVAEDHARWEEGENRKISADKSGENDTWQ